MILKIGFLERSDIITMVGKYYQGYKRYMEKISNLSVELVELTDPLTWEPNTTLDVDVYLTTIPQERLDRFWLTHEASLTDQGKSALISANPAPYLHENWSIVNIEPSFQVCFLVNLLFVSLILMVMKMLIRRVMNRTTSGRLKPMKIRQKGIFKSIINTAGLLSNTFVSKSIPGINRTILSVRVLFAGWLLGVQIFNIYLTCNMKSDLSKISYQTIDSFDDFFSEHQNTKLGYVKGTSEEEFLLNMKEYQSLKKRNRITVLNGYIDLLDDKTFQTIYDRTVVWLLYTRGFKMLANIVLEGPNKANIYVGKNVIAGDIQMAPIRRNLPADLTNKINIGNIIIFECKSFQFLTIETEIRFEWHLWEEPNQDLFNTATFQDFKLSFIVLSIGYCLVIINLIVNIIFFVCKTKQRVHTLRQIDWS